MTWITYESDRIVHLPSNTEIIMRSYKIAWNDDNDRYSMVINYGFGDEVYDRENENDCRKLQDEYCVGFKKDYKFVRRYVVVLGTKASHHELQSRSSHLDSRLNRVPDEYWRQFDNVTECYAAIFSNGYHEGKRKLLYISTNEYNFNEAMRALQSDLHAIRLDGLYGRPSEFNTGLSRALWDDVIEFKS